MMKPDFRRCVFGIIDALIADFKTAGRDTARPIIEKTSLFVLSRHSNMPDYLRLPFRALTLIFDSAPILTHGRPFHRLSGTLRKQIVKKWKSSSISFKNDFIRFFETLGIFAFYSYKERFSIDAD
ncbi:MAG: hypothetical protein R6W85_00020 [Gillisia sp.]